MKTADAAKGKWRGILLHFGVDESVLNGKHQSCVFCGGKDRFRYTDFNQNGDYYCSGCGPGKGLQFLTLFLNVDFKTAANMVDKMIDNVNKDPLIPKKDPLPLLKFIQKTATVGPNVAKYIRSRGLNPVPDLKEIQFTYYNEEGKSAGKFPAMAARVVDKDRKPISFHITYLQDGKKADVPEPKKTMTGIKTVSGCAVRFGKGLKEINVAEGIETSLAVLQMTQKPTWSTLTANGMEQLEIPDEVEKVNIYGDNDSNFTGQKAAYVLGRKLKISKPELEVEVHISDKEGTDWLDYFLSEYKQ